jgi:hypothetical protein
MVAVRFDDCNSDMPASCLAEKEGEEAANTTGGALCALHYYEMK